MNGIRRFWPAIFLIIKIFPVSIACGQKNIANGVEKRVDSLIQTYHQRTGPGIAVAVVRDGQIIYQRQDGFANLEYGIPISDSTVFHIASVSKQFTAFLALLLEQEGKLSLDNDISQYIPELKGLPKVTIRQLANHTHGFANTYELGQLIGISSHDVMTQQQMITMLLRQKQLNFEPGAQYQYNNSGFALLAEIIQRVSGKSFGDFARERIFVPLGMSKTLFLDDNATIVKNKAYSYKTAKTGYIKVPFNYTVIGASALNTTLHDLSLWAMNFDNPKIGNQKIFDKMKPPSLLNNGQQIPYAFGQEMKTYKGLNVIFHGGGDAGYRAYLLRVPAYHFSVIVMGNLESFNPSALPYDILDLYLKEFESVPNKEPVPRYSTDDLRKWQGSYEIFPGSFFKLVAQNDTLFYQPFDKKDLYALPVAGDRTFTFPYAPFSKLVFGPEGLRWHFSDFSYRCERMIFQLPYKPTYKLEKLTGIYWNDPLKTSYKLVVNEGRLMATHALNGDIVLQPLARDEFYSNKSFFGRVKFIRDDQQRVTGFVLSGQNLKDVSFVKTN
ncbi:serine hydrolase domain-containing protein [Dyadobacter sp. OTU695]|uniref:serine hydrolase domain-containing protein n=1 Tax=Dyadobacter sp. OTU695 TaxID=3043860 RepID=UPI00313EC28F